MQKIVFITLASWLLGVIYNIASDYPHGGKDVCNPAIWTYDEAVEYYSMVAMNEGISKLREVALAYAYGHKIPFYNPAFYC